MKIRFDYYRERFIGNDNSPNPRPISGCPAMYACRIKLQIEMDAIRGRNAAAQIDGVR